MIEVDPLPQQLDIGSFAIERSMDHIKQDLMCENEWPEGRVFWVVYTSPMRAFGRRDEKRMTSGYDPIHFMAKDDLPTLGWDVVLYSVESGEAVARIENRPAP